MAAEAAERKKKAALAGNVEIEMHDLSKPKVKTANASDDDPYYDPNYPDRVNVGGRRRKSRRGKSRKYKRTLKRRKNKTKNRK